MAAVEQLDQPAPLAHAEPRRARQGLRGDRPRAFAGVDAAGDRQAVGAESIDRIGLELDVGIDPEGLLEAGGQRLGGHFAAADVDGRIPADPPDLVAAALEFDQPLLARGHDVRGKGNEDDAAAAVQVR